MPRTVLPTLASAHRRGRLHLAYGPGVPRQLRIAGEKRDPLAQRLGQQQSVEGVLVQEGQAVNAPRVLAGDGQFGVAVVEQDAEAWWSRRRGRQGDRTPARAGVESAEPERPEGLPGAPSLRRRLDRRSRHVQQDRTTQP